MYDNIIKANEKYQHRKNKGLKDTRQLEIGDFVWVHLRKERFPHQRKNKLMPRAMGPYQILDKYRDNAFKIDLPAEYGISSTFNIGDLTPYLGDTELRAIPFQEEGNEPIPNGSENTKQENNAKPMIKDSNNSSGQESNTSRSCNSSSRTHNLSISRDRTHKYLPVTLGTDIEPRRVIEEAQSWTGSDTLPYKDDKELKQDWTKLHGPQTKGSKTILQVEEKSLQDENKTLQDERIQTMRPAKRV